MAISKLFLRLFMVYFLCVFFICAFSASFSSSSNTICNLTPYSSFCESNLPSYHGHGGDIHEYTRFFLDKSLSSSKIFLSLLSEYLKSPSLLSKPTILALQDCHLLTDLNNGFLSRTLKSINSTNTLGTSEAETLHTLLTATLTNQDTCLTSLQETTRNPENDLLSHLSTGTKLYSISLALFKRGWKAKKNTERKFERNDHIMWEQKQYEIIRKKEGMTAAPDNFRVINGFFVIHVVGGVYEEYVSIPTEKQYLMMIGDGINQTIITGNHSVADGWTTFSSATFAVIGQGFVAINITFRNTAGAMKHQAVALRSGADFSAFYNCSFEGYQDTLYAHSLTQFYRDCDIYGTVDFIFGNAGVVLQNCNIYPRLPMEHQFNVITAQGRTDMNQNSGISVHMCTLTAASDLASSNRTIKTYLGRPWKPYSQTVYMQSFMNSLIDPLGWVPWLGKFQLDTLYYAEFDNRGPGSDTSNRVTWPGYHVINATDAVDFTVASFILGYLWLPDTGVPYYPDLGKYTQML
ncbi:hypothetical protein ACSQ67_012077 [Phaseolus vulgaris]